MSTEIRYNAVEFIPVSAKGRYLRPVFSFKQRMARFTWLICWSILYRLSPRPFHRWRALLLRLFGAKMGPNCHFYPTSRVWAPWNLLCEDMVTAGDGAEIYNPAPVHLRSHAILSQNSYLCGAAQDFDDPAFPLLAYTMEVGAYAWICARACVGPGVQVGEGAVLGLASAATSDLQPWGVYGGVPAIKLKERKRVH